jgi:hypothetical protein
MLEPATLKYLMPYCNKLEKSQMMKESYFCSLSSMKVNGRQEFSEFTRITVNLTKL